MKKLYEPQGSIISKSTRHFSKLRVCHLQYIIRSLDKNIVNATYLLYFLNELKASILVYFLFSFLCFKWHFYKAHCNFAGTIILTHLTLSRDFLKFGGVLTGQAESSWQLVVTWSWWLSPQTSHFNNHLLVSDNWGVLGSTFHFCSRDEEMRQEGS